jgi:hypothetical protein
MKVTRIGCSENLVPSPGRVLMYWSAPVGFFAPTRETIEAKARYPEIFEGRTTAPSCSEDFSQKSIRGINSELYAANIPVVPIAI